MHPASGAQRGRWEIKKKATWLKIEQL